MAEAGVGITALIPTRPSLEDLFFRFTEADGAAARSQAETEAEAEAEARVMDAV
jgi:hypothetical protein